MTEPVDQPVEDTDLSEDVVTQLTKAMDTRFSGFQGVLDKNISTLRNEFASQLEEVSKKNLTPDELADLEETNNAKELRQLRRQVELLNMRKEHPEEVDFLSEWLEKDNFTDQLSMLKEFRNAKRTDGPTLTEEPVEPEGDQIPVDLNNSPRKGGDSLAALVRNAGSMTRENALKLLEATNEKGILHRLRKSE